MEKPTLQGVGFFIGYLTSLLEKRRTCMRNRLVGAKQDTARLPDENLPQEKGRPVTLKDSS
jgi:hypothetical protein